MVSLKTNKKLFCVCFNACEKRLCLFFQSPLISGTAYLLCGTGRVSSEIILPFWWSNFMFSISFPSPIFLGFWSRPVPPQRQLDNKFSTSYSVCSRLLFLIIHRSHSSCLRMSVFLTWVSWIIFVSFLQNTFVPSLLHCYATAMEPSDRGYSASSQKMTTKR